MEKQLVLELSEVILGWEGKPSDVNLRVSLQGEVQILRLRSSTTFAVKSLGSDVQLHILAQSGNIALASITYRLNTLLKQNKDSFDNLIELKVPGAVLKNLVPGVSTTKIVKIRLIGKLSKNNPKNKTQIRNEEKKVENDADVKKIESFEKNSEKSEKNEEKSEKVSEKNEDFREELKIAEPEVLVASNKLPEEKPLKLEEKSQKFSEETPQKAALSLITLSSSSINSKCSYIKKIRQSEFHLSEVSRILNHLRSELGTNFAKFLQEAIRRDSKISPIRKQPSVASPKKADLSQISFTSTYKQDDNEIEVPSVFEANIEKLGLKNPKQLLCSLVALLGKTTYYESVHNEIKILKENNKKQDESIDTIKKSLEESHLELKVIWEQSDEYLQELQARINSKKKILQEKKTEKAVVDSEKKNLCEKLADLREENKKIKLESDPGGKIGIVIDLRKEIEDIEQQRTDLEESFKEYSMKIKDESCNLTAEQIRVAESKATLLRKIKDLDQESNNFSRENWRLSNQISKLEGLNEICISFQDLCDENIKEISVLRTLTTDLSNAFFKIRSSKDDSLNSFNELLSNLHSKLDFLQTSENSFKNDLDLTSSKISKISSEINQSLTKSEELSSLILTYQDLPLKVDQLKYKLEHNKEIRDQVINEIYFFSDFIFSMSQTFLFQSRINHKIKAIVEEKDFDVQAMRESLAHFKIKNPVYHPVKTDLIDKALADYLNSRNSVLPLPFVRESYGIYYYGTRKINISQERNKLTVKVGGGFLPIDEFIENYTEIELEKFEKRNQEITPQMRKLMAKWVGGITGDPDSSKINLKQNLVNAAKDQKFSTAFAVKENSPKRNEDEVRPETPVIGDD